MTALRARSTADRAFGIVVGSYAIVRTELYCSILKDTSRGLREKACQIGFGQSDRLIHVP